MTWSIVIGSAAAGRGSIASKVSTIVPRNFIGSIRSLLHGNTASLVTLGVRRKIPINKRLMLSARRNALSRPLGD
ncbi:MAG: hypothetical protein ABIO29_05410 [Sphingomicrobium sp.]